MTPHRRHAARTAIICSAALAIAACVGCDVDYVGHLVFGQLDALGRQIPIDDALRNSDLTDLERARLALVKDVRRFGIDVIGLTETSAYTQFDPNGAQPSAYVLTAAEPHRLASYSWDFPFIGRVPYKGFFDLGRAQREAAGLSAAGYDTLLGPVDGFSTLGLFPDPVRQSNLANDEIELAEFILHEMTHGTVFKPSDADFNEAMATFVGRAAALRFFETRHGAGSSEVSAASARFSDKEIVDAYVIHVYDDAAAYFDAAAAEGLDRDAIVAGREAVFSQLLADYVTDFEPRMSNPGHWAHIRELNLNNASILAGVRYQSGLADFADVLNATDGDFAAALQVFSEAAAQADSRSYLRQWVKDHE